MTLEEADEWYFIKLKDSYILATGSAPSSDSCILEGSILITLTKATKVRWLRIKLFGHIVSKFFFDTSKIPNAKPCEPRDKFTYSSQILDVKQDVILGESKDPHILQSGTHTFPFSLQIPGGLPPTMTSSAINIKYQITSSLQLASIIPFSQQYQTSKPVILIHHDIVPDDLLTSGTLTLASKRGNQLSGRISLPSLVFPQSGTIPMMIYLSLQGCGTSVNKINIELWESVFQQCAAENGQNQADGVKEIHVEERLVSRQVSPVTNWATSTSDNEPVSVAKRLLFKVPSVPLKPWSESTEDVLFQDNLSTLPRGFCHSSKTFSQVSTRVEHTLRTIVYFQSMTKNEWGVDCKEDDFAEHEIKVSVVGLHLQETWDETLPPSYHRSFTNVLVDGARLAEIDRNSIEALRDISLGDQPMFPPCYEESISSIPSSPSTRVMQDSDMRDSLEVNSLQDSGESSSSTSTCRGSQDSYAYDLAAYVERTR
ncbi:hypothetical protein BGZ76_006303 [Entomortierella beljakovae]|nr:hypothetical protein BGZ76_006303 [Entomortierella beljakovae]